MTGNNNGYRPISGVECGVINCMYNTDGRKCTADHICVKNENAMKKAETFCSTFTTKNSAF